MLGPEARAAALSRERDSERPAIPWWERENRRKKVRLLVAVYKVGRRGDTVELDEWTAGELLLARRATDDIDGPLPEIPKQFLPKPIHGVGWYQ